MNIIIPIHNKWANLIFTGKKPFEFRKKLPKNLVVGDTLFIYETSKNNGSKMVVGEAKVKNVTKLEIRIGASPMFLKYWATLNGNKRLLDALEKIGDFELSNYKKGTILDFMYTPDLLDYALKYDKYPPDVTNFMYLHTHPESSRLMNEARIDITNCDEWLKDMGFYDSYDMAYWNYAIELFDIVKYETPKELNSFNNTKYNPIEVAPQSFCYTTNKK